MKLFPQKITRGVFKFMLTFSAFMILSGGSAFRAQAETIYASTVSNDLAVFESDDTCSVTTVRVSGLQPDEKLLGIDFRPATGELYGLGSTSRLYVIDPMSGVATAVGAMPFTPALAGSSFGFDFNPTVDRIRIVSDTGQNLRANPNNGTVIVDGTLAYAMGDVNFGAQPNVASAAYTNPDNDPTTGTLLYDIDTNLDVLVNQNPANSGTLLTIGSIEVNTNDLIGFDISTSNTAYAAMKVSGKDRAGGKQCGNSLLYTVNLMNGEVSPLGFIGTKQPILGLAAYIAPPPPPTTK